MYRNPTVWALVALALGAAACTPATPARPAGARAVVKAARIILLAPEGLQAHNVRADQVASGLSRMQRRAVGVLAADGEHRDVFVYLVLYPHRRADVQIASRPALPGALRGELTRALRSVPLPRTRFVSFPVGFVLKVNRGCPNPRQPFTPRLSTLSPSAKGRFLAASLPARLRLLRGWARRGVLPVIGEALSVVDPKFKGVRAVGAMLKGLPRRGPLDVSGLTDKRQSYWRAALEMVRGDMIIPTVRIFLHVANGELDRAQKQLDLMLPFAKDNTPADYLLKQLARRLQVFYQEVNRRVRAGIARHDRKQYDEALRIYRRLLAEYPQSAWARYEAYFTRHSRDAARAGSKARMFHDWQTAKGAIYAANPLYPTYVSATTGEQAYEALLRLEIRGLFKKKGGFAKDYVRLADIALDLGLWGQAADLYLRLALYIKPQVYASRPVFAHFLYCLEKLGVTRLKASFKGNHAASFAKIARERQRLMKANPVYQAMCKKRGPGAKAGCK